VKESKLKASRLARVVALAVVACFTQYVPARVQAGSPDQAVAVSLAEARTVIEQAEKAWAKARVVIDTNLFEKTLAPEPLLVAASEQRFSSKGEKQISRTTSPIPKFHDVEIEPSAAPPSTSK
jgi:hypothetical protein